MIDCFLHTILASCKVLKSKFVLHSTHLMSRLNRKWTFFSTQRHAYADVPGYTGSTRHILCRSKFRFIVCFFCSLLVFHYSIGTFKEVFRRPTPWFHCQKQLHPRNEGLGIASSPVPRQGTATRCLFPQLSRKPLSIMFNCHFTSPMFLNQN